MTSRAQTLTADPSASWTRAAAQIEALHDRELAFAVQVRRDLIHYPGYFSAAIARTEELRAQHHDRPHWSWAAERWAALMAEGGLPAVLRLLDTPEDHQELLSASPFAVMRPPLPENDFYAHHAAA